MAFFPFQEGPRGHSRGKWAKGWSKKCVWPCLPKLSILCGARAFTNFSKDAQRKAPKPSINEIPGETGMTLNVQLVPE